MLRSFVQKFVLGWLIVAAAQPGSAQSDAPPPTAIAAAPVGSAVDSSYRLGVGDKVRITVFNEVMLSGEFTVSDMGDLSLPLIGSVHAASRTPGEMTKEIESKLADGYLRDPRVAIDVLTYRPFYILGEVEKPGEYPYVNNLTALNAVALAQGYTYRANKRRVFIRRAGESVEKPYVLTPDLKILPGDTVRVGERYF